MRGKEVGRIVDGYLTAVRVVDRFDQIPMWVTCLSEDDEMDYYLADYTDGLIWGVKKEESE